MANDNGVRTGAGAGADTGLFQTPASLRVGTHSSKDSSSLIPSEDETQDEDKENADPSICSSGLAKVEDGDVQCTQVSSEHPTSPKERKPLQELQASHHGSTNSANRLSPQEKVAMMKAMIPSARSRSHNTPLVPPAPSSLNSILHQHPRTRLFVHPKHWTSLHLELLCTSIVDYEHPQPCYPRPAERKESEQWRVRESKRYNPNRDLFRLLNRTLRSWKMYRHHHHLYFRYGHIKRRLSVVQLFYDGSDKSLLSAPSVALVNLRDVARRALGPVRRENGIRSPYTSRYPEKDPPREKWEPCVLAVLVALARGLFNQRLDRGLRCWSVRVHAIDTSQGLGYDLFLYSADIPFEFVLGFLFPSKSRLGRPLEIRRTPIYYGSRLDPDLFFNQLYSVTSSGDDETTNS